MKDAICQKCHGRKWYQYDRNHSKPCDACCPHDGGWFEVGEHQSGFVMGGDNRCCLLGCGTMRRDLPKSWWPKGKWPRGRPKKRG